MGAGRGVTYDGCDDITLAARLGAPRCVCRRTVTSTLDLVHELGAAGAPGGSLVLADEQVKGRGRRGRPWYSPLGSGIWLGYLVRPAISVTTGLLGLRVGMAVADAVRALGGDPMLKWPNDVLLRNRKLAGILCEARWLGGTLAWVAVGIGINVQGPLPPEMAHRAIALNEALPAVVRLTVLDDLVPRLHTLSDRAVLSHAELRAYDRYDALRHRRIVAPVQGTAAGVDQHGALLVETPSGLERVVGGSVVAA